MQVGDVALLRFVRGAMHDVDRAAVLFREHLAVRQELGLDAVRARLTEESERKGGKNVVSSFHPRATTGPNKCANGIFSFFVLLSRVHTNMA